MEEVDWNAMPSYRQEEVAKSVGLTPRVGKVSWKELVPSERDVLAEVVIPKSERVSSAVAEVSPTTFRVKEEADIVVYDNGGESIDRYTVFCDDNVFGMGEDSTSPQGFNQYIGSREETPEGEHLGKRLSYIPSAVRRGLKVRGITV